MTWVSPDTLFMPARCVLSRASPLPAGAALTELKLVD
jgi:hypothetical protein